MHLDRFYSIARGGAVLALGLLGVFIFFTGTCSGRQGERSGPFPSGFLAGLAPPGWKVYDRVMGFGPENLYDLIDGAAELYLSYDVDGLTFVRYVSRDDPMRSLELYVYDMGTATNAFGIFSVERMEGGPEIRLGRAGYRSGSSCFVWKGRFYMRIVGSGPPEPVGRVALELAQRVVESLEDSGEPVWGIAAMPKENLVPGTLKYFRVDAMGLDFMRDTYTAEYNVRGRRIQAFLSRRGSAGSAAAAVKRYADHAARYGKGSEPVRAGPMVAVLCSMGEAFDVVFQKGRLVGGVVSVEERDAAIRAALAFWKKIDRSPGLRSETGS